MEQSRMTQDDVPFGYRLQLFALAARTSVSHACRTFGVHRSTYYAWKRQVDRHGLETLRPRERRRPQMPNADANTKRARRNGNPSLRCRTGPLRRPRAPATRPQPTLSESSRPRTTHPLPAAVWAWLCSSVMPTQLLEQTRSSRGAAVPGAKPEAAARRTLASRASA